MGSRVGRRGWARVPAWVWGCCLLVHGSCAPPPPEDAPAAAPLRNAVLLTDTLGWPPGALASYRDSLTVAGYRVLVSGAPGGETAPELLGRLPWLLQPGVDLLLYDPRLAGPGVLDCLRTRVPEWVEVGTK